MTSDGTGFFFHAFSLPWSTGITLFSTSDLLTLKQLFTLGEMPQ